MVRNRPRKAEKDWLYFEWVEAASQPACPVCSLLERRENRYIDLLFYENVNDPGVREKFRAAGGLCRRHTDLFLKRGDALGLSILANDLLSLVNPLTKNTRLCPLCAVYEENEERLVKTLPGYLYLTDFWKALEESDGFCLRHFGQISAEISDKVLLMKLSEFENRKLTDLQAILEEIIRKSDYHFQSEKMTEKETQALRTAWSLLQK